MAFCFLLFNLSLNGKLIQDFIIGICKFKYFFLYLQYSQMLAIKVIFKNL
jgi:hypothetical protein